MLTEKLRCRGRPSNWLHHSNIDHMSNEKQTSDNHQGHAPLAGVSASFSFYDFVGWMEKLMYLENLDEDTKLEYMHDWYVLFKQQGHRTVPDFVQWQFPESEVNSDTHEFWKRSLNGR